MQYTKSIIVFLLFLFIFGCKDEFLLETSNYKPIMVVDGMITNDNGPYVIKISNSSPINQYKESPYENCTVTIYDNTDFSEVLTEKEPGIYTTNSAGIIGEVGKSYRISILTPDGIEYGSDFQELKEPIGISDLSADLVSVNTEDFPEGLPGYLFYVSTETSNNKNNFFLWKAEETYEFTVDFDLLDIIFGKAALDTNDLLRIPIVNNYKDNFFRCWETKDVNNIYTAKTSNLSSQTINKQPLLFVGTDSKKLQIRYSLLLNQYIINEDAYYFWKGIEDQVSEENFLVANQPYNIVGNIRNLNNSGEKVLGYFTVAAVTKKRIFVNSPNTPLYYNVCSLITNPSEIFYILDKEKPPFYLIEYDNSYGFGILRYEYCVNCTLSGGKNTKPDFWIDF